MPPGYELLAILAILAVPALVLARSLLGGRWTREAVRASIPVAERRITRAALPGAEAWTAKPTGYRDMHYIPDRKDAVSLDPSRDRGPDMRVLVGHQSLVVRIRVSGSQWALVRIDATRELGEVIVRAFVCPSKGLDAGWQARLENTLEPVMDALLRELTGSQAVGAPRSGGSKDRG